MTSACVRAACTTSMITVPDNQRSATLEFAVSVTCHRRHLRGLQAIARRNREQRGSVTNRVARVSNTFNLSGGGR